MVIYNERPAPGDYRLLITFEGLLHVSKKFSISATKKDIDFGIIYMYKAVDMLHEWSLSAPDIHKERYHRIHSRPIRDKTQCIVEDQLKKLPGVEVNASGTITAQGET